MGRTSDDVSRAAMTPQDEDSGAGVVRALHDAFNDRDEGRFLGCLAEDVEWQVEGNHPLAGVYVGRDRLWDAYFAPLWASPARYGDGSILTHGDHVVALTEVLHNFGEGQRAWETVEVFRVAGGKVTERWARTSAQEELDGFLTRGCAVDPEAADLAR